MTCGWRGEGHRVPSMLESYPYAAAVRSGVGGTKNLEHAAPAEAKPLAQLRVLQSQKEALAKMRADLEHAKALASAQASKTRQVVEQGRLLLGRDAERGASAALQTELPKRP